MLVLSRKEGESIDVGHHIKIWVVRLIPNRVQIGIEAPNGVKILRSELEDPIPKKTERFHKNG